MHLRKIINFNTIVGLTLPKEYAHALSLKHGDYAEVFLRDNKTIVIKKHGVEPKKITTND